MYKNNLCKSFADQNHGQFKHVIRLPDAFRQENPVAFFSRKLCTEFGRPKVFFQRIDISRKEHGCTVRYWNWKAMQMLMLSCGSAVEFLSRRDDCNRRSHLEELWNNWIL